MRYPKLRELKEAIRALVKGPYTSRFPYEPHKPYERFRGRTEFNQDECIGCGACVQVCPAKALVYKDEVKSGRAKRILTVSWDMCIFCGSCQENCPVEKGIVNSCDFDLSTTEKRSELKQSIEKELLICADCKEIIAPVAQMLWVAKKLGPLCFSNASLMQFYLQKIAPTLEEKIPPRDDKEFLRSDRIRVLCPRCRRQAVIKS